MASFLDIMMDDSTAESQNTKLVESLKVRSGGSSNIFYRYKNMDFGQSVTLRFLPASSEVLENEVQPDFWIPKKVIRLRFENPDQPDSEVVLPIPAMQMYTNCKTENDLVLRQAKALFDEGDRLLKQGKEEESKQVRAKASYHWHRGESIAQCFVIRSPFLEQDAPENIVRLVEMNKQIMNVINSTLKSEDEEVKLAYWPCHGRKGTNFVIKKTKSGEWPKYDAGSCFSRTTSAWTTEQLEALEKHGLFNLRDFLPAQPTDAEYELLADIVRLSIEGEKVWNPDWEDGLETVKVYKTNQQQQNSGGSSSSTSDDADVIQSQVRDALNRMSGTGSSSTNEILSTLSRTSRDDEPETETVSVSDPEVSDDADPEPQQTLPSPTKSTEQVRSVVDRIKGRTSAKAATAD